MKTCRPPLSMGITALIAVNWRSGQPTRHLPVPDKLFEGTDNNVGVLPSLAEALQAGGIFHGD